MKKLLNLFLVLVCTCTFCVSAKELDNDWAVTLGLKTSVTSSTNVTSVKQIKFYDTVQTCVGTSYDVGVNACVDGDKVIFSNDGKIVFPSDSSYLFAFFKNASFDFNDSVDFSKVTDASRMFDSSSRALRDYVLDLSSFDTSSLTNMNQMFQNFNTDNPKTLILDLTGFDTSKVTNMSKLFSNFGCMCSSIEIKGLDKFNTSNVTDMSGMFSTFGNDNTNVSLDVSSFDTRKVTTMNRMFMYNSVTELDLSNFDTSNVTDFDAMFKFATNLKYLDISSFNFDKSTDIYQVLYGLENLEVLAISNPEKIKEELSDCELTSDKWFNKEGVQIETDDMTKGTYYAYKPYKISFINKDNVIGTIIKAKGFDVILDFSILPEENIITTSFDIDGIDPIKTKKITTYTVTSLDDTYNLGDVYTLDADLNINVKVVEKDTYETIKLPKAEKKNSKFIGWMLDGKLVNGDYEAKSDVTLIPSFEEIVPDTGDKVLESIIAGVLVAGLLVAMVIIVKKTKE